MIADEVKGSLNDVSSLNEEDKASLTKMSYIAANDVASKKGRAKKTRVKLTNKDGIELELIATRINIGSKTYPKAQDKLKAIGLAEEVNEKLLSQIKDGDVNSTHITDILKLNVVEELTELDPEIQETVVENIIENRNERNLINAEEVSSFVLRNGSINQNMVDIWYRGMLRLIKKLAKHADVGEEVISQFYEEQKQTLEDKIVELNTILDRYVKKGL